MALVPSGRRLVSVDLCRLETLGALRGAHFGKANCAVLCPLTLDAYSGANDRAILCWTSSYERECAFDSGQEGHPDSWSSDDDDDICHF